ncbi:MAG: tautomerase family protein [Polyangiaceae bacterium]|nr:tautomerase family protein [Polyangiaceae bacterium]
MGVKRCVNVAHDAMARRAAAGYVASCAYRSRMPFIDIATNTSAGPKVRQKLIDDVVVLAEKYLEKPRDVTMARLSTDEPISFKGTAEPAAYVSIRAIGLPSVEARTALVAAISGLLDGVLDVPVSRTFIVFDDVPRDRWGVSGSILK